MNRLSLILLAAGALLFLGAPSTYEYDPWYEDPDVPDWSDEKVLEYIKSPIAEERRHAGLEMLRRWKEGKIIAYLKKNWREGCFILDAGWPSGGSSNLEAFLLESSGKTDSQCEDAVYFLSGRGVPDGPRYDTGRIGAAVRDEWFKGWITRIPPYPFFTGAVEFMLRRGWVRERFYVNNPLWVDAWGAYQPIGLEGRWWVPWRLSEYRAIVQILAGDPYDDNTKRLVDETEFFAVLDAAVKTGRNEADLLYESQGKKGCRLASTYGVPGLGQVPYACLFALVMNRPDWIPAIDRRLAAVKHVQQTPIFDKATNKIQTIETTVYLDRRCTLVLFMATVATKQWEPAKVSLKQYWRREWPGFADTTWASGLWARHPWLATGVLDKGFATWYGAENKPFTDVPDVEFLKGEWR